MKDLTEQVSYLETAIGEFGRAQVRLENHLREVNKRLEVLERDMEIMRNVTGYFKCR